MKSNQKRSFSFKKRLINEYQESIVLLRSIPAIVVSLFIVSVILMNLLANKTIFQNEYLAIDGGFLISWLSFLMMDIVTKHFGLKEANRLVIFAFLINILVSLLFYLVSIIPTPYQDNSAFNNVIGGTWYVIVSSTIAFIISSFINNFLNYSIGKLFVKNSDSGLAFFVRSYISTFFAQLVDNLLFSILTFIVFAPLFMGGFSWTFVQCLTCSLLFALLELVMEILFSPLGLLITRNWQKHHVGEQYFAFLDNNKQKEI